jgi:hypothetical protein
VSGERSAQNRPRKQEQNTYLKWICMFFATFRQLYIWSIWAWNLEFVVDALLKCRTWLEKWCCPVSVWLFRFIVSTHLALSRHANRNQFCSYQKFNLINREYLILMRCIINIIRGSWSDGLADRDADDFHSWDLKAQPKACLLATARDTLQSNAFLSSIQLRTKFQGASWKFANSSERATSNCVKILL